MFNRFQRSIPVFVVLWAMCVASTVLAAGLEDRARAIVQAGGLTDAGFAAHAVDLTTGEELLAINADGLMIPASNMKLITTAAALHVLGKDFVFETELILLENDPQHGTVVIVRGDGDPAFGDPVMLEAYGGEINTPSKMIGLWIETLKKAGITRVQRLIVDDRVFDRDFIHESWPTNQLHKWYCAQVAGINFHANVFHVFAKPTRVGSSPNVHVEPHIPSMRTINRAQTSNTDGFWADRQMETNVLTFRGKVKSTLAPIDVTMHDPSMVFGEVFAHHLQAAGITVETVDQPTLEDDLSGGEVLHKFRTPLSLVLDRCNKPSMNLYAEALYKRMGRQYTGAPGSWHNGAAAVRAFLSERAMQGGGATNINIADGSGMSRENKVTARALVEVLRYMHEGDQQLAHIYRQSLSQGGVDGTLRNRFKDINGTVWGKSGYIARTGTLSGYIIMPQRPTDETKPAQPPRVIAFSILLNDSPRPNSQMQVVQNRLVALIDEAVARSAGVHKVSVTP